MQRKLRVPQNAGFRQVKKRLAACFPAFGLVRTTIGKAFAFDALEDQPGPVIIVDTDASAVRVAERKLVQITLQVLFAAEMIDANHALLKHAEEVLDIVGRVAFLVHVLTGGVVHGFVLLIAMRPIKLGLVGNERSASVNIGPEDRVDSVGGGLLHGKGADLAGSRIDQPDNRALVRQTLLVVLGALGRVAVIRFIRLRLMTYATHAGRLLGLCAVHGFADTMSQKPNGFVGDAKHPVQLMRRHALLGSDEQMDRQEPLMDRDFRPFHDGAGAARELVAAVVAQEHPGLRLAAHRPFDRFRDGHPDVRAAPGFSTI